mgnify:FL=1
MEEIKTPQKPRWTKFVVFYVWAFVFILPFFIVFLLRMNVHEAWMVTLTTAHFTIPSALAFFYNYYIVVPRTLYKRKILAFYLANIVCILFYSEWCYVIMTGAISIAKGNTSVIAGAILTIVMSTLFSLVLSVGAAVGVRMSSYWNDIKLRQKEEEQKKSEAELTWLKNQLNPHFLFNTLNNISSLVQIDPDEAQESISQLSDLLRYALYDSNQKMVPLCGEIDFMKNYIRLMQLRCPDRTDVQVDLNCPAGNPEILPLLYISLIENAFKHGLSNSHDSFIHIRLNEENGALVFTIENSNFPKNANNHSGSGIGLENLRRRLELVYPGKYELTTELRGETYFAQLILHQ